MRFHVFRYLTKPIDKQRLFRNLKDALQLYLSDNAKIAVETKSGVHSINTTDLVCIEAQSSTIIVHTTGTDYESIHPMAYWQKTLDMPCFFLSHRSFTVNLPPVTDFAHPITVCVNVVTENALTNSATLSVNAPTRFKNFDLIFASSFAK